eukprot:scaffold421360_cov57-Attheya_sp.AAC.6
MAAGKRANSFSDETVASCISKCSSASSIKPTAHKAKSTVTKPKKRGKSKKPKKKLKDKPNRPLSAYNLFFQSERKRMVQELSGSGSDSSKKTQSHFRKMGFAYMARHVAEEWKKLDTSARGPFNALAVEEKARYQVSLAKWEELQKTKLEIDVSRTEEQEVPSSLPSLEAVRRVSTDSCSMNVSTIHPYFQVDQHALPISDMMVLTMRVIEQAKEVLREPIIQAQQASKYEMTREFCSHQGGHCISSSSSSSDFASDVAPIQQEHNLDPHEVEWEFQGASYKLMPVESLARSSSSVELSQADYSNLADLLDNDHTEEAWEDHNSI